MTKAEATLITSVLHGAKEDLNEISIRIRLHQEDRINLDDEVLADLRHRAEKTHDKIETVMTAAFADLGDY